VADTERPAGELSLKVVASGQLVTLFICPVCAAIVADVETHRRWHERAEPGA
jgi:hypothetical protein